MGAAPQVSVIIPAYQAARYLPDALDSVLAQTYRDFEIVVADDASTDETPAVLARYGDAVRCVRLERNGGISVARNAAIAASRGDLFALLDADDTWAPEKLALQVAHLDRDPATALVMGRMRVVDADGAPTRLVHPYADVLPGEVGFEDITDGRYGPPSAAVFRRALFDDIGGFDPELRMCEDLDFWLRATLTGRIDLLPEIVGDYRMHGANISGYGRKMLEGGLLFWTKWLDGSVHGDLDGPRRRIVRRAHNSARYRLGVFELREPATRLRGAGRILRAALRDPLVDTRMRGRRRNPLARVSQLGRPWIGAAAGGLAGIVHQVVARASRSAGAC